MCLNTGVNTRIFFLLQSALSTCFPHSLFYRTKFSLWSFSPLGLVNFTIPKVRFKKWFFVCLFCLYCFVAFKNMWFVLSFIFVSWSRLRDVTFLMFTFGNRQIVWLNRNFPFLHDHFNPISFKGLCQFI